MALPAMISTHNHVSEREIAHYWPDGQYDNSTWEDCLWCSVVELLNDTYNPSIPDTLAYAERLRDASGEPPTGGSNAWQAQTAIYKMHGVLIPVVTGFAALWDRLDVGYASAIAGSMGAFPYGHTLRRHLPGFAGGHSVYVARVKNGERFVVTEHNRPVAELGPAPVDGLREETWEELVKRVGIKEATKPPVFPKPLPYPPDYKGPPASEVLIRSRRRERF